MALAAVVALTVACGGGGPTLEPELPSGATALDVLEASREAMAQAGSYRFGGTMMLTSEMGGVQRVSISGEWTAPDGFHLI
jgi:hypothetical protein